jgi:hypothetical protein
MLLPYVEYSYFPSIQRTSTISYGNNSAYSLTATYPATASDFHVGVHVRFPVKETRLAPYGVFGIGSLTVGQSAIRGFQYTDQNGPHTLGCLGTNMPANCTPLSITAPGGTNLAVNFGGGVRYYLTPRYGIRAEVKGYKPFNGQQTSLGGNFGSVSFDNSFLKAEAGFFIQFR